jgi:hypothetical protein
MIGINQEPNYKQSAEGNQCYISRDIDINTIRSDPLQIESAIKGSICEAVNCFFTATIQIDVKVGQLGYISLLLCNECVSKFRDE